MARTIKEIQEAIKTNLVGGGIKLSTSAVAEWRLWTYVMATAIHVFELTLDFFRAEIDTLTNKITPGTVRWYAEMCYRFQNGHELLFDNKTAMLYYEKDVPQARIIKVVAITEAPNLLSIKAAKQDTNGKIVPLSPDEKHNFTGYIDAIKFAGMQTDVISTVGDKIRYDLEIFFDPAIPSTTVRDNVLAALEGFKTALGFDSMFYKQKFIDVAMAVPGVITVDLKGISRKGTSNADFVSVNVFTELESGYYDYAPDCVLTVTSKNAMR